MNKRIDSAATVDEYGNLSNARLHEQMTEGVDDRDIRAQTRARLLEKGIPPSALNSTFPDLDPLPVDLNEPREREYRTKVRLGYSRDEMTGHGFRAMASSLLNEKGWHPDVIELQLAHSERNKVRAAYNRAQRLAERRAMMQAWADYLDALAGSSRSWLRIIENHSMLEQRHHGEGCSRKTPAMSENESSSAYGVLTPLRSEK